MLPDTASSYRGLRTLESGESTVVPIGDAALPRGSLPAEASSGWIPDGASPYHSPYDEGQRHGGLAPTKLCVVRAV